jgi:hypothetical protein
VLSAGRSPKSVLLILMELRMFGEIRELAKQLNTSSDVAVVGGAGLIGFVVDAAINIVPIPIFSPGVCGITAAGGALALKRGWEARRQGQLDRRATNDAEDRRRRLVAFATEEASLIENRLRQSGKIGLADKIAFQAHAARITDNPSDLLAAIEKLLESEFGQSPPSS